MIDLEKLVQDNLPKINTGHVATYIPGLAKVNPNQLGIVIFDCKNNNYQQAGQANIRFAIESISKVITFLYAIQQHGTDYVCARVSTRQTGFPFNSILNLEIQKEKTPLNPFVNAGAILTTSLIDTKNKLSPFEQILNFAREICNDSNIYLDTNIFESEDRTGDTDRSLAYYLKSKDMIEDDVTKSLETYFKQCSMMVTAKSLANLGAVLANNGIMPWNKKRIISQEAAILTKSLMMTTGLYNESGIYSAKMGIPTKSGVGGGLMSAVPSRIGIGIFSPALDPDGNSAAGLALLQEVAEKLDLNIFK